MVICVSSSGWTNQTCRLLSKLLRQKPLSPLEVTIRLRLGGCLPPVFLDLVKPAQGLVRLTKLVGRHRHEQPVQGLSSIPFVANCLFELFSGLLELTGPV